jgi:hypothetical protein
MAANTIYSFPTTGTVPPTVLQAALVNVQTVQVGFSADADTTATVTYNWAAASPTNTGVIVPFGYAQQISGTSPVSVSLTFTSSVVATLTKLSAAGSVGSWLVVLMR